MAGLWRHQAKDVLARAIGLLAQQEVGEREFVNMKVKLQISIWSDGTKRFLCDIYKCWVENPSFCLGYHARAIMVNMSNKDLGWYWSHMRRSFSLRASLTKDPHTLSHFSILRQLFSTDSDASGNGSHWHNLDLSHFIPAAVVKKLSKPGIELYSPTSPCNASPVH